jgi:CBS domain-containing protein
VTPQTSMREAAAIMSELKLHRLPVVDDRGTLVGVLSSADVMKDLLHIVRNLPPAAATESEDTDEQDASP